MLHCTAYVGLRFRHFLQPRRRTSPHEHTVSIGGLSNFIETGSIFVGAVSRVEYTVEHNEIRFTLAI